MGRRNGTYYKGRKRRPTSNRTLDQGRLCYLARVHFGHSPLGWWSKPAGLRAIMVIKASLARGSAALPGAGYTHLVPGKRTNDFRRLR